MLVQLTGLLASANTNYLGSKAMASLRLTDSLCAKDSWQGGITTVHGTEQPPSVLHISVADEAMCKFEFIWLGAWENLSYFPRRV